MTDETRPTWWKQLPVTQYRSHTDMCWHCGHCRDRHSEGGLALTGCRVAECACIGGMAYVTAAFVGTP